MAKLKPFKPQPETFKSAVKAGAPVPAVPAPSPVPVVIVPPAAPKAEVVEIPPEPRPAHVPPPKLSLKQFSGLKPADEIKALEREKAAIDERLHWLLHPFQEFPKHVKGTVFASRADQDAAGKEFRD